MAEMTKLLGFMSSWDRAVTLEKYSALLDTYSDDTNLIEVLGTPTKVAIDLARDYVPTPPPAKPVAEVVEEAEAAESDTAEGEEAPAAETEDGAVAAVENALAQQMDETETAPVKAPKAKKDKPGVRPVPTVLYTIAAVLIGLPIAIVLIALGVPALMFGIGLIVTAVLTVLTILGSLSLFSDILLLIGGAMVAAAIGLLLLWLGLWISLELGWLWIGKVIFALGRKVCLKKEKEAEANG